MTGDSAASAWDEAQRLLLERGAWTTEGGAYLESDQVTVLVHPVFDDEQGRALRPGTVDLVVTVRPRPRAPLPPGAVVSVTGTAGGVRSRPLGPRGQAVFRGLPAGEWTARLVVGQPAVPAPRQAPAAEVTPLRRIPRLLAAAAGGHHPPIRDVLSSADGRLTTEVEETPEARLVVRISAVGHAGGPALVRMRWALVVADVTEQVRTLVVPLAPSEDAGALVAKYDLGSLDRAQALEIGPAEWADPSELTGELVRQAFDLSLYGAARRGWETLAASGVLPPPAQAALREMLER